MQLMILWQERKLFLAKNHRYDGENELGPERDAYRMERRLKRNIQYRMAVGK